MIEALRILKFVMCVGALGCLAGMFRAYWRLWRHGSTRERQTWVPGSMVFVTLGVAVMMVAMIWSQVMNFHADLTGPSVINFAGVGLLTVGLWKMNGNVSRREAARQIDAGQNSDLGEH